MTRRIWRWGALLACLTLLFVAVAVPAQAHAEDGYRYIERSWNVSEVAVEVKTCYAYTSLDSTSLTDSWYVAYQNHDFDSRLEVKADTVNIIICNDVTVTCGDGIHVPAGKTLNIFFESGEETGKLIATADTNYQAAIGGNSKESGGNITVHGGTVEANSYDWGASAAGIGGGWNGSGGDFTIYDGNVTAKGANVSYDGGAGIGGGKGGGGGHVRIYGGTVNATGGTDGAGIGGGDDGSGGHIEIWGGDVTATGASGAGIGGGQYGAGGLIEIHGGTVKATGNNNAAGIGGGYNKDGGTVNISGGDVTATGGKYAAGIGGGVYGGGGNVTIEGGTVTATGGYEGAGIGGGYNKDGGTIKISGGNVTASGGECGAGIGGGCYGIGGTIDIFGSGTTVNAKGGDSRHDGAAGVGGGWSANSGTISIYDGANVTAEGKMGGAGIGGGDEGSGDKIVISNCTVTARSEAGVGIGGGRVLDGSKGCGNVTITNSTVDARGEAGGIGSDAGSKCTDAQNITITSSTVVAKPPSGGYGPGIGGANMTITITDSQVEATGADGSQGIGGRSGSDSGSVTIDCGHKRVIATGGKNAPGIGGGRITINSGDIRARGGRNAAGIGGGSGGKSGVITINGGTVRAWCEGPAGAGIGSGAECDNATDAVDVTINGGTVVATGGYCYGDGSNSTYPGAAIGAGGYTRQTYGMVDSNSYFSGQIRFNGGNVTAQAADYYLEEATDRLGNSNYNGYFKKDSGYTNYCNAIGSTSHKESLSLGKVYFNGATVRMVTSKGPKDSVFAQPVRAGEVIISDSPKHQDVQYQANPDDQIQTVADNERVSTLTTTGKYIAKVYPHKHEYAYTAVGNAITARCKEATCPLAGAAATLTVGAANANYTGYPYHGASPVMTWDWVAAGLTAPTVEYEGRGGTAYARSATPPTDAGTYAAVVTVGDTTARADFAIAPRRIAATGATATGRAYRRGDAAVGINAVSFKDVDGNDVELVAGVDYEAAGTMQDANAGRDKPVSVAVTLKNGNYRLEQDGDKTTATVSISKAPAPSIAEMRVPTVVGSATSYDVTQSVAGLMPADAGVLGYKAGTANTSGANFAVSAFTVDGEGTVSATVTYTDYAKEGDTATLPVIITSTNYQPATAKVVVLLTSKTVVGVSVGGAPAGKTYGDPVFELTATLDAGAQADGGTWTWYSSDESVLKVTDGTKNSPTAAVEVVGAGSAALAVLYESEGEGARIGQAETSAIAVDSRPLTVTAKDLGSIYAGATMPALPSSPARNTDYSVEPADGGLVDGDEISGLTLAYSPATSDPAAPGTYAVVPSGATVTRGGTDVSKNYAIAYANGSLVVKPKETQTITVAEESIAATYGDSGRYVDASVATGTGEPGALSYDVTAGSDVVTVDDGGVLTIKGAGTATVTVKAAETATHAQATKDVTVTVGKVELIIEPKDREIYVYGQVPSLSPVTDEDYEVNGLLADESLVTPPTLSYATEPNTGEPGSYEIVPSGADAGDNYEIAYRSGWLTIRPKNEQTISADDVTVTCGDTGKSVNATSSADVGESGAITYAVKEGGGEFIDVDAHTGALTVKSVPEGGRAYVVATAAETDTCAAASEDIAVNIRKAPSPATFANEAAVMRGGHVVELADYVALNGATGKVTYGIEGDACGCTLSGSCLTTGEAMGRVVVKVDVAEDAIREAISGAIVVKVNDRLPSAVKEAPKSLAPAYNGTAHPLVTAGVAEGGTMVYALGAPDGRVPEEFEFGHEVPSATDAGTHRVWYRVVGDADHNDSAPAYVDATIAKATAPATEDVTVERRVGHNRSYEVSQSVADRMPKVAGKLSFTTGTPTTSDSNVDVSDFAVDGAGMVSARVMFTDNAHKSGVRVTLPVKIASTNYQDATVNVVVEFTPKSTTGVSIAGAPLGATYGGDPFGLNASVNGDAAEGGAWTWSSSDPSVLKVVGSGSAATVEVLKAGSAIVAVLYEDDTYIGSAATQSIAVGKASITPSVALAGWTYGDAANAPGVSGNPGGGAVTYEYKARGADDGTYIAAVPARAGDYTVRATVAETTNYKGNTCTADFTIARKQVSATVTAEDKTYDGTTAASVSATVGEGVLEGDSVTVTGINGTFADASAGGAKEVAIDRTDAALIGKDAANYEVAIPETATAAIGKRPVSVKADDKSSRHGEEIAPLTYDPCDSTTLAGDDVLESLGVKASTTATSGSGVGEYPIELSGGTANPDYDVTLAGGGTYTITKASGLVKSIRVAGRMSSVDQPSPHWEADIEQSLANVMPGDAGVLGYAAGTPAYKGGSTELPAGVTSFTYHVDPTTGKVTARLEIPSTAGDVPEEAREITLPVTVRSKNYEDSTISVVVAPTKRGEVAVAIAGAPESVAYGAVPFTLTAAVKDAQGNAVETKAGDWYWYSSDPDVLAVPEITDSYAGSSTVAVTVGKPGSAQILAWYEPSDGNVIGAAATDSVTVGKKGIAPSVALEGWTYGDAANEPSVSGNPGGGAVAYEYKARDADDGAYAEDVPDRAGDYTVRATVAETDSYKGGACTADFAIARRPIGSAGSSQAQVTLEQTSYPYDGTAKEPAVTSVVLNGKELEEGADYAVSYEDNVGAGTARAVVTGKGNYTGAAEATFTIVGPTPVTPVTPVKPAKTSIAGAQVTLEQTSYTYDGTAKEPAVTSVVLNGRTLSADTDYSVSYEGNTAVGTARAVVTGKGRYAGAVKATFTIVEAKTPDQPGENPGGDPGTQPGAKADIAKAQVTLAKSRLAYDGAPKRPAAKVVLGGEELKPGADYELTYEDNTNAGTATATVTGKGAYTGSASATFKITKAKNALTVKTKKKAVRASGKARTVKPIAKATPKYKAKVTFKKARSAKAKKLSGYKALSVNKKTGKVRVRANARPGTYKLMVKVTAAKTANTKAASKKVVVTVKVKPKAKLKAASATAPLTAAAAR